MKLFTTIIRISFLIIILFITGCKAKHVKTQDKPDYANKIDSLMRTSYERDLFNGNVLVVKNNTIIYQKSFGFTDGTQQKKLSNKSIFNIGSIAKEFNGVAIMMLQERGLLNINDSISKFDLGLPDWSKKVTIKHLLNYAGGIPSIDIHLPKSDQDAWKILRNSDSLLFEPGTSFLYDNSNVFLQKRIVEKVTGQSYNKFIVENIVKPLKMTNSVIDPIANYPNRTSCYDFDKVQCPELEFISGWLWTSINDLYKWIHAMNSNTLISQKSFNTLLRNPYVKGKTSSLGEYYKEDKLQVHNGSSYKFESIYLNDFKNDVTIILLSNNLNRVRNIGINIYNITINEPYRILKMSIYQAIRKETFKNGELGIEAYQKLKKDFPDKYSFNDPSELNRLGYELLRAKKIEIAIKIFHLATKEFPNNANTFDSLGSAYFAKEQYDLALNSYENVLKMNETNENAKMMVEKINKILIKTKIDDYLNKTMKLHNIPGLALAVVKNNEIVYENYFGKASLENNSLVDKNTLFRIFSATKLITSTGVFQLIQKGKLNLEDEISKYLNDLPSKWQKIKIKNLLSHSSGLPDFIRYKSTLTDLELMDKLSKDKMEFATGNQFRYNQTNYWLLAQIIEKVTGTTYDEYVIKNQFDNSTKGILFSSNSQEIIPNRAIRYFYNSKTKEFEKDTNNNGKRGHSGNGLNITLNKFIEWNKRLDNNELLEKQTKSKMWTPFNFINQKDDFMYGWGNYPLNNLNSYGFSGGNLAAFRKFTSNKTTIILLSNGYKIPAYDIIINDIAKIAISDLKEKNLALEENVMISVLNNRFNEATLSYSNLKKENPNSDFDNLKWNINSIANSLTREEKIKEAFQVFKFNSEENPNWWVSFAGLAEIYKTQKDSLNAIENYQKAILLNENNEWDFNDKMNKTITELKKHNK